MLRTLMTVFSLASLVSVLFISLLLVLLNPQSVTLDVFGLVLINSSLGILLLSFFILGTLFALCLFFIPNAWLSWRNKRLQKQLRK